MKFFYKEIEPNKSSSVKDFSVVPEGSKVVVMYDFHALEIS